MLTLLLAFIAGALTIFSPCVLPLAPIVVAGGRAENPLGPLALAAGLAATFGIAGGALVAAGVEVGDSWMLRAVAAALMLATGLVLLFPILQNRLEMILAPIAGLSESLGSRLPRAGLLGQFALGAVLAFAWAPCAGPTLGAAFALAASGGSMGFSMLTMAIFALGAASALLAAGYGLGKLALGRLRIAASAGRIALGAALTIVGAFVLTGVDQRVEVVLLDAMPNWLVTFAGQL